MNGIGFTRLAIALLGAAVLMSALLTAIAFLVYGSWEYETYAVMANTRFAALVAISAFTVFNLTAGLTTVLVLLRIGRRGALTFALSGVAAGLIFGLATALAFQRPVDPVVLSVLAVIGALMLLLIRALGGIRGASGGDRR